MTRQRIRRGVFHSIADLQASSTRSATTSQPRLYPRRRHLTRQAEERAHPPCLQARRDALHDDARDRETELRQADHNAVIT
jgi:hypothetical protein